MEVIAWQIGIILGIGLASVLFGKSGWILASAAAAIWTFVMIFESWLMILQFVTVFAGWAWGASIVDSPNYKVNNSKAWGYIGGIIVLIIAWVIIYNYYIKDSDNQSQSVTQDVNPVSDMRSAPIIQPAPPPIPTNQPNNATENGEPISMNFQNIEVRAILQIFADFAKVKFSPTQSVIGSISYRCKDRPWNLALQDVLTTNNYDEFLKNDTWYVGTYREIDNIKKGIANPSNDSIEGSGVSIEWTDKSRKTQHRPENLLRSIN